MPRPLSTPKLFAAYLAVSLLVPAAVLIGVLVPDILEVSANGVCPGWHAQAAKPCAVGDLVTSSLFGPDRLGLTLAMVGAWSLAITMALGIYLTMRAVMQPPRKETD